MNLDAATRKRCTTEKQAKLAQRTTHLDSQALQNRCDDYGSGIIGSVSVPRLFRNPTSRLRRFIEAGHIACAACFCVLFTAACGDSATAPAANAPFSQTDIRVGTGPAATSGSTIVVHYTGWLYDPTKTDDKGLQFETSVGGTPFEFVLGQGQVIAGWDRGLEGLRVGGLRRLIIPPSLGYCAVRQGRIPPNAGLVFEVELIEIK